MKKNVIVSLADSNYFELLNELIDSIKSFKESSDIAICILDAGLSNEQRETILNVREILALKKNATTLTKTTEDPIKKVAIFSGLVKIITS